MTATLPRRGSGRLTARTTHTKFSLILISSFTFTIALAAFAPGARARQAPENPRLVKIEVTGLERYGREQFIADSGLQLGQLIDVETLDAASERLMSGGLLKNLSYKFTAKKNEAVVTFVAEEAKSRVPVVFDNFVWFTDDELKAAIRERIPAFDGTIPDAGGATDTIAKALSDLLREKNISGQVEYTPSAELSGRNPEHLFAVKGGNLGVCALSYPGARAVPEQTLVQKSVGILSNEFSRKFVSAYAEGTLLPLYHERGYLRAGFLTPQAKLQTTPNCTGVTVAVEVDEGMAYVWEKAQWAGNGTLSAQELDAALGMRRDEIANGLKIAGNLDAVRKAYGRKGHLAPTFGAAPDFDDARRRVTYRFKVNEGPQYRMGALTINGLSERDANDLRVRWSLQSREIYDASYVDQFVKKNVPEFIKDALRDGRKLDALKIESSLRLNPEKQTVDVTLTVKQ
ncbi:MAG TPA: hypothetical protein VM866_08710 [Pyrinomonadaceae bacterium]|nr:hypothetical protein [Pyrinomonadaceae bacterium]